MQIDKNHVGTNRETASWQKYADVLRFEYLTVLKVSKIQKYNLLLHKLNLNVRENVVLTYIM